MECVLFGFMLFAALVATLLAVAGRSNGREWNEAFKHVGRQRHGVFQPGGWFHWPSVWFQHGEAQARLTVSPLRGAGNDLCLQMTIQQREARSRCEIFHSQNRPSLLPLQRGLSAIEFDWENFRRRWRVLADDGDEARRLLSDGVRLSIELLWREPVPAELLISLTPQWLAVRKVWRSARGIDVESFVERVCSLSDQLNLAAAAGIEFVAGDEPQLMDNARCGVCGDSLASEIVVCRRCNTPHHRECWQYGGGCATYGCGSRDCFVPGVAPLVGPHWEAAEQPMARPFKPR